MPWSPVLSTRPLSHLISRSSAIRSAHAAAAHREEDNEPQQHPSSRHPARSSENNNKQNHAGPSNHPDAATSTDRKGKGKARDLFADSYTFPTKGKDGQPPGPYEILNLNRNASAGEIKSQYYRLALLLHPDSTHPSSSPSNFATLNKAYTLLSSPTSRQSYLQYNHGWSSGPSSSSGRSYDPTSDPMYAEVLRRKQAGFGGRPGDFASRGRGDAGMGAWGAFGLDGKWRDFPEAGVGGEPKYMSHPRFASVLFVVGGVLTWVQYHRLNRVSNTRMELLEENHQDASHALASAREEAKLHGQARREQIRRRVNETKVLREIEKQEQEALVES